MLKHVFPIFVCKLPLPGSKDPKLVNDFHFFAIYDISFSKEQADKQPLQWQAQGHWERLFFLTWLFHIAPHARTVAAIIV